MKMPAIDFYKPWIESDKHVCLTVHHLYDIIQQCKDSQSLPWLRKSWVKNRRHSFCHFNPNWDEGEIMDRKRKTKSSKGLFFQMLFSALNKISSIQRPYVMLSSSKKHTEIDSMHMRYSLGGAVHLWIYVMWQTKIIDSYLSHPFLWWFIPLMPSNLQRIWHILMIAMTILYI